MPDPVTLPTPESIEATTSTEGIPNANPDPGAPPSIDTTPSAPAASDIAPANAPVPRVPMQWQPPRRSGLAGIIDEFRDAIAGSPGHQIYTDEQGNKYVGAAPDSNRGKWMRVAANLAQGAARGYAAGQGPGGQGRAFAAGFGNAQQQQDRQRQQTKELTAEARQENLERFNTVMQQLQLTKMSFENTRLGMELNESAIKFSQEQNDRQNTLHHTDLGVYDDHFNIADVVKQDPSAVKDWIDHKIEIIPEVGTDGKQHGVHLWLRTTPLHSGVAPAGTSVWDFQPPSKPGEKGTMVEHHTTEPKNDDEIMQHNTDAFKKYTDWEVERQKPALQAAQLDDLKAQAKERAANTTKAIADAAKANAETRKLRLETDSENVITDNTSAQELGQMMVDGRAAPSLIKNRKNYQTALAWADRLSREQTGQPFDASLSETMYESYKKGMQRYLSGDKADSIASFDKFFGHAENAYKMIDSLRNTDKRLVNAPLNTLSRYMGGKNSNAIVGFQQALEVARSEWQAFTISNKAPTDQDRRVGAMLASEDAKPSDIGAALYEWAKTAQTRMRADDFEMLRLTRGRSHIPMLMSNETEAAMKTFGLDPQKTYASAPPPQQMVGPGPNVQPAAGGGPPPAHAPVPPEVQKALQNVGPGKHTLSDKSVWIKNPDGSIDPGQ